MKKIIIGTILVIAVVLIVYSFFHPSVYCKRYYEVLGISTSHLYGDIIKEKGDPNSTAISGGKLITYYDGVTFVFDKGVNDYILLRAEVTGEQYRFGIWSIGVGTDRKKIENVYQGVQKIIDLPESEFGVIDDDVWVHFKFNSNNKVKKVLVYYGP